MKGGSSVELVATVEAILKQSPGDGLCAACLAFACEVSLLEMRPVVERLVGSGGSFDVDPTCASCRRTVTSAVYRPRLGKCAHCSQPVATEDVSTCIDGDLFHDVCLRRLMSDETIRTSRALSRRSRELIEDSRRHVREHHGRPPLDAAM